MDAVGSEGRSWGTRVEVTALRVEEVRRDEAW